ncbi:toll/interleukin-1 receptor domain-containing protein [Pseudodonghicola flavimaris]|uniref:Toll/interleukin-1 receptor domain-containing protein n=1 Tax=Pseudodonghicola flavimaris TaxID=3050036 RepID=A0ABT7EXF5_9RHOB|nr:toll/interleukin-1 receptor domain-containing protein [Pseudodonghicola flavimaris]MDK3017032.1 toll/interleukin-1 receptor domain-containing protein [Pseudodonghicola flavimaris]
MTKVFFSYSHKDESLRDMLQTHLAGLQHKGLIETWHDRRIGAGDEFENAIDQNLNDADIILLLVSSDFIGSKYCYDIEMRRAMERHEAREARVIPVILRHCDWHDLPFGKLMAAPRDGKAIKSWPDIDEAFLDVVQQIKAALPKPELTQTRPTSAPRAVAAPVVHRPRSGNLSVRKSFSDADKESFLEEAFAYIAAYFENSLQEFEARNTGLTTKFRQIDANRFTAVIYKDGTAVSRCKISLGTGMFSDASITYSTNDQASDGSYNEALNVEGDDQHIYLKSMGMAFHYSSREKKLTQEGGAELYWAILMEPLQ